MRVFDAVQQHVHAADAQHGGVKVKAEEGGFVELPGAFSAGVNGLLVVFLQVFGGGDQKAGAAAGGVANGVAGLRGHHVHHQLNDVARRAELAVLPGGGDFAEHVFVEVALGVSVVHGDGVDHVHHLGQQCRRGDGEARIFHVLGVGGLLAGAGVRAQVADEGEDLIAHGVEDGAGIAQLLEHGPAQVALRGREDGRFKGLAGAVGFVFFEGLDVVQPLDEEQVGELLDHLHGVGDAAAPEGVPDAVDLVFDAAGDHGRDGSGQHAAVCVAVCVARCSLL